MIIETLALGTITLTYKAPDLPPFEVGREIPEIPLLEPLAQVEVVEITPIAIKPVEAPTAPHRASDGTNLYEKLSCTWWVKSWKPEVPNSWGNANTWGIRAAVDGWTVSGSPVVGAVAWSDRGQWGHVAYVIGVSGEEVTIKEGNYDYNGSVRTKTVPVSMYSYIY